MLATRASRAKLAFTGRYSLCFHTFPQNFLINLKRPLHNDLATEPVENNLPPLQTHFLPEYDFDMSTGAWTHKVDCVCLEGFSLDAALARVLNRFGGQPAVLILMGMLAFALGSSTIGMAEEYIPLVAILITLCVGMRMDTVAAVGIMVVGYGIGYGTAVFTKVVKSRFNCWSDGRWMYIICPAS